MREDTVIYSVCEIILYLTIILYLRNYLFIHDPAISSPLPRRGEFEEKKATNAQLVLEDVNLEGMVSSRL